MGSSPTIPNKYFSTQKRQYLLELSRLDVGTEKEVCICGGGRGFESRQGGLRACLVAAAVRAPPTHAHLKPETT